MDNFLADTNVYGNSLTQWGFAIVIATAIVLAVALGKPLLLQRLERAARRTRLAIDDALVYALKSTQIGLVALVAFEVGAQALTLPGRATRLLDGAATIATFLQVGLWANALLQCWLQRKQAESAASHPGAATSLSAVGFVGRIVLWSLMTLLVMDNLGINITTLVAGLGIGGIAVALAVQNILGDLFASLSIVIDKPFVIGDFIIVDTYQGTVEHVGLKTTRIRSVDGEQIVFSNSDLLKTRMRNYKRMHERRKVFPVRVRYDTPPDKLARIPGILRALIEKHAKVRFERSHFWRFGEASLDFETVFWVTTPDYNVYMDVQQQLNLELIRVFEREGIEFARPPRAFKVEEVDAERDGAGDGRGEAQDSGEATTGKGRSPLSN